MLKQLVVLISGSGTNLQAIIDACEQGDLPCEVSYVISNKANAYGLERARKHSISNAFIDSRTKNNELSALLNEINPDLIVLAGYLSIIDKNIIQDFQQKIINIHPSLIPHYAGKGFYGMRVHQGVIENKESKSGATVHFVDEGVDTGKIIMQESLDVLPTDTPESLQKRVLAIEHKILIESIKKCLKGEV